jgi:hypothetical protein
MAYSRDPHLAFESEAPGGWGPPLAHLRQPVTYHRVTLAHPALLEDHLAGQRIPVLQVDWLQGTARTFDDPDDALNGVCSFEGSWTFPAVPPESVSQYVMETLRLLGRGHSLLDPQCTCRHGLSAARCRQLGITSSVHRNNECRLSMAPREVSAAELSKELAVDDVCLMPGLPFISAVEKLCTIRLMASNGRMGLFFSPLGVFLGPVRYVCAFPPPIAMCVPLIARLPQRKRADLMKKLQTYPLPFEQPIAYPGMKEDVQELEADGLVHVITDAPHFVLYYLRPEAGTRVDADIQTLWDNTSASQQDDASLKRHRRA